MHSAAAHRFSFKIGIAIEQVAFSQLLSSADTAPLAVWLVLALVAVTAVHFVLVNVGPLQVLLLLLLLTRSLLLKTRTASCRT